MKLLWRVLNYRPGAPFWIISVLVLFLGMIAFTQYRVAGRVDLGAMVNQDTGWKYFQGRNPNLEETDSYPHTSVVVVRDRQSGRTGMLDMAVVQNALVQAISCDGSPAFAAVSLYAGATDMVCFAMQKPDSGAGTPFQFAASFVAPAKDSRLETFYKDLFAGQGLRISVIESSSRVAILEGEDEHGDTLARVAIRTGRVFLAMTAAYRLRRNAPLPQK